jgi:hypothetical protein
MATRGKLTRLRHSSPVYIFLVSQWDISVLICVPVNVGFPGYIYGVSRLIQNQYSGLSVNMYTVDNLLNLTRRNIKYILYK